MFVEEEAGWAEEELVVVAAVVEVEVVEVVAVVAVVEIEDEGEGDRSTWSREIVQGLC